MSAAALSKASVWSKAPWLHPSGIMPITGVDGPGAGTAKRSRVGSACRSPPRNGKSACRRSVKIFPGIAVELAGDDERAFAMHMAVDKARNRDAAAGIDLVHSAAAVTGADDHLTADRDVTRMDRARRKIEYARVAHDQVRRHAAPSPDRSDVPGSPASSPPFLPPSRPTLRDRIATKICASRRERRA